jgi:hypothetical protein
MTLSKFLNLLPLKRTNISLGLLYIRSYCKCFIHFKTFTPHNKGMKWCYVYYLEVINEETKLAQATYISSQKSGDSLREV